MKELTYRALKKITTHYQDTPTGTTEMELIIPTGHTVRGLYKDTTRQSPTNLQNLEIPLMVTRKKFRGNLLSHTTMTTLGTTRHRLSEDLSELGTTCTSRSTRQATLGLLQATAVQLITAISTDHEGLYI